MASTHNNIKLGMRLKFENGIEERVCLPQTLNGQDKIIYQLKSVSQ